MPSRSPALRALFSVALAVCCWSALAAPASAAPPQAQTHGAEGITETTATFHGDVLIFGTDPFATANYRFEYGTTDNYGTSTPTRSGRGNVSEAVAGLTPGTVYHLRLVATNSAGETGFGDDYAFKTLGGPPLPQGGTRASGETPSTGSSVSKSNPIAVSASSEKGGTFYIDTLPSPTRPGRDPEEEVNPEDEGSKERLWYGSAIRVTAPPKGGKFTFVFRIDGDTDLSSGALWRDAANPVMTYGPSPYGKRCRYLGDRYNSADVRYFDNGDAELTQSYQCDPQSELTFNFYNRPWGWRVNNGVDVDYGNLDTILDKGSIGGYIVCYQKCARSGTASIAKKTAKALGLKSTTIASGRTDLDATLRDKNHWDGQSFKMKLTAKARKKLKRANRITINYTLKAVGTKGQVLKKTFKRSYEMSPESRGDDINRAAAANHAPMNQTTRPAREVTTTSAKLSGTASSYDASACTWHFEYGTTTSYGQATPAVSGCPGQGEHVQTVTGLSPKTTYHFRYVVVDHSGATLYGGDQAFTTLDPSACPTNGPAPDSDGDFTPDCRDNCPTFSNPQQEDRDGDKIGNVCDEDRAPAPPNSKTTSRTLEPGGSMSTGAAPSPSNPVVVKLTTHGGGTWHIDEMLDPDRPGVDENAEGSERDAVDWFGSGIRITPPNLTHKDQLVRIEFTIDGSTNLSAKGLEFPREAGSCRFAAQAPASFGKNELAYLRNGDVRLTLIRECFGEQFDSHFFNAKWGIDRREGTTSPVDQSLNEVLKNRAFGMTIACKLRCEREAVATISKSSAKQLGLKSNVIAKGSSGMRFDPDERHCPSRYPSESPKGGPQDRCVVLVLTSKARKKLKRVKSVRVTIKWTAKGARAGQKAGGSPSQVYKRTVVERDDLG